MAENVGVAPKAAAGATPVIVGCTPKAGAGVVAGIVGCAPKVEPPPKIGPPNGGGDVVVVALPPNIEGAMDELVELPPNNFEGAPEVSVILPKIELVDVFVLLPKEGEVDVVIEIGLFTRLIAKGEADVVVGAVTAAVGLLLKIVDTSDDCGDFPKFRLLVGSVNTLLNCVLLYAGGDCAAVDVAESREKIVD